MYALFVKQIIPSENDASHWYLGESGYLLPYVPTVVDVFFLWHITDVDRSAFIYYIFGIQ